MLWSTYWVCDTNMKFVYVITGWEGSGTDSRVLRDAVNHTHGLKVFMGICLCFPKCTLSIYIYN
ncbi:hypothetical protein ACS0TY_021465 [Phlomoides rotata]